MVLRWERFNYALPFPARARRPDAAPRCAVVLAKFSRHARFRRQGRRRGRRRRRRQSPHRSRRRHRLPQYGAPRLRRHRRRSAASSIASCIPASTFSPTRATSRSAERLNEITPGKFPKKTSPRQLRRRSRRERRQDRARVHQAARHHLFSKTPSTAAPTWRWRSTSKTHPYKAGFEPFPGDVYRVPFAYCYRCSYSLKYPSCEIHCARHLEDTFKRVVAAETVAAVIVEPVMGEGGFIAPPPEFFPILTEICRKYGILFIADEVQTGFARTGAMFACEQLGFEPDLVVTAKSLGGGLPLAAVTGRAEIMDAPGVGGLGGTFAGNPVACERRSPCSKSSSKRKSLRARQRPRRAFPQTRRANGRRDGPDRRSARLGRNAGARTGSVARNSRARRRRNQARSRSIVTSTEWSPSPRAPTAT